MERRALLTISLTLLMGCPAYAGQLLLDKNFYAAIFGYIEKSESDIRWIDDQSAYKSARPVSSLVLRMPATRAGTSRAAL